MALSFSDVKTEAKIPESLFTPSSLAKGGKEWKGFLAAFLFGATSALAEVPEWVRGKILFNHYESIGPARDARSDGILQSGFILHGTASPTSAKDFVERPHSWVRLCEKTSVKGEAQELWLAYSLGGFDFKLGQIITPWVDPMR